MPIAQVKAIAAALLIESKFLLCQVQLCWAYYVSEDQGECTWIYKVGAWIGMLDWPLVWRIATQDFCVTITLTLKAVSVEDL